MVDIIFYSVIFYVLHLFLVMSFSLHKVPFIEWTYTGGDTSAMTDLSSRMNDASNNLRQSLPVFLSFAVLSVFLNIDNIMLAQTWLVMRVVYLACAIFNLYKFPMVRTVVWLPSIVVLIMMGLNIIS